MPGATTARLVVCAFEMPMKLFMMPQTVPNNPTKGAVAPIVASTPVPRASAVARLDALEPRGDPFLGAFAVGEASRGLQFGRGRVEKLFDLAPTIGKPPHALEDRAYAGQLVQRRSQA